MSKENIRMMKRDASEKLKKVIKNAATNLGDFYSHWNAIKKLGEKEGFNEKELQQMVTEAAREELEARGFTGRQISDRLYHLKNQEERNEYSKNHIAESRIHARAETAPRQTLIEQDTDEVARLRTENTELNEVIKKMSFSDNPDVFMINKKTEFPNERYFESVGVTEARTLLKSTTETNDKIEIAWRILN